VSVSAALGRILLNSLPNSVRNPIWCEPALLRDGGVARIAGCRSNASRTRHRSSGRVANEVFQCSSSQVAGHDFAFCERSKRGRIANFQTKFNTSNSSLQIVWMGQRIDLDLDRVIGVRSRSVFRSTSPLVPSEAVVSARPKCRRTIVQVFVSKPFLQMTRDQNHFARIVCMPFHLRTARAHFNRTTPQTPWREPADASPTCGAL
jgi:hypothetical protein